MPIELWVAILFGGVLLAMFRAFRDVREERDKALAKNCRLVKEMSPKIAFHKPLVEKHDNSEKILLRIENIGGGQLSKCLVTLEACSPMPDDTPPGLFACGIRTVNQQGQARSGRFELSGGQEKRLYPIEASFKTIPPIFVLNTENGRFNLQIDKSYRFEFRAFSEFGKSSGVQFSAMLVDEEIRITGWHVEST